MLETFIALIIGVIIGSITAIIPGLHSNLVATFIVALNFTNLPLPVILISIATTHLFVTIIPALYLSLPNESTAVSLLPGQQLVKEGKGYDGVMAHANSALLSFIILIPCLFFVIPFIQPIYKLIYPAIPFLLMLAMISFFGKEKLPWRLIIILSASILGILTLSYNSINEPMLPLLSGLFGIPSLISSLNAKIPEQKIIHSKITTSMKAVLPLGWLAGSIVGFLPGVGTAHAATIAQATKKFHAKTQLALLSAIVCANFLFSLATSTSLGKARNGVIAILMQTTQLHPDSIYLFSATALASAGIAYLITRFLAKVFAEHADVFAKPIIKQCLILFISVLVFSFSGWKGILVLVTASFIGSIPVLLNLERSMLMSAIIMPVLVFFWPF